MGEIAAASTSSTPRILGPDGSVVRGGAGLMPGEVESSPPVAAMPPSAEYGAGAPSMPAAAPQFYAPSAGNDVVWVPMAMSGGAASHGWAPAQVPAMTPSSLRVPAMLPSAPARYEPAPAIRTSETGCSCGVRPSEAPGANRGQMAFPIGRIFYDFGKEARLDYFVQAIANWRDSLGGRGDPIFGPDRDQSGEPQLPTIRQSWLGTC